MLRERDGEVEADLQRFYGIDLAALWRGELSLRRLSVLIHTLPPESATTQSLEPVRGWSVTDYLIADVFHAVSGEPHPARPAADGKTKVQREAEFDAALLDHKRRMAERDARLAAQMTP